MAISARTHTPPRTFQIAAAGNLVSGDIVQFCNQGAVYIGGIPASTGETVAITTEGNFDVLSASATTFAVGAPVYWDEGTKLAVTTLVAGDYLIGVAIKAKVDGETTVRVALNEYVAPAST
jgi:predicted RecA/RadA family phage recombinase